MRLMTVLVSFGAALASVLGERTVAVLTPPNVTVVMPEPPGEPTPVLVRPVVAWVTTLAPLRFFNTRTLVSDTVRLYADDGSLDEGAASAIDRVIAERDAEPRPLDRRVLRLVVKAAAHFRAREVLVVSTFRDGARKGSRHKSGQAMDFSLAGVSAAKLAAYLRGLARVGVGVYTHRRTQFVHLDAREESYHWIDASPPGVSWRESKLTDRGAPARDAAYDPSQDLPVGP